jgi:hypothetical protein
MNCENSKTGAGGLQWRNENEKYCHPWAESSWLKSIEAVAWQLSLFAD